MKELAVYQPGGKLNKFQKAEIVGFIFLITKQIIIIMIINA